MAKTSSVEKDKRRRRMAKKFGPRRARLKAIVQNKELPMEERFAATGRPHAFYRKHKLSRIALRELGNKGLIPGLVKSSW